MSPVFISRRLAAPGSNWPVHPMALALATQPPLPASYVPSLALLALLLSPTVTLLPNLLLYLHQPAAFSSEILPFLVGPSIPAPLLLLRVSKKATLTLSTLFFALLALLSCFSCLTSYHPFFRFLQSACGAISHVAFLCLVKGSSSPSTKFAHTYSTLRANAFLVSLMISLLVSFCFVLFPPVPSLFAYPLLLLSLAVVFPFFFKLYVKSGAYDVHLVNLRTPPIQLTSSDPREVKIPFYHRPLLLLSLATCLSAGVNNVVLPFVVVTAMNQSEIGDSVSPVAICVFVVAAVLFSVCASFTAERTKGTDSEPRHRTPACWERTSFGFGGRSL